MQKVSDLSHSEFIATYAQIIFQPPYVDLLIYEGYIFWVHDH